MAQCRHWKQRFDPAAKMVWRKSRKLGLCGAERCEPGDPVTEEQKQALGRYRLKMWWEAGMMELLVEEPQPSQEDAPEKDGPAADSDGKGPESSAQEPSMTHTGGGWYDVVLADGSEHRVRGKKKAKALLDG